MKNVMIDLETLGNGPLGVFPICAAVLFDPITGETGKSYYQNIDIQDQVNSGRELDPKTIQWWFSQGKDAQEELMKEGVLLWEFLAEFRAFLPEGAIIWSKGIDFDLVKIESAYKGFMPWKYWNKMDARTIIKLGSLFFNPKDVPFVGIIHNALDDCYHQIKLVNLSYAALGISKDKW